MSLISSKKIQALNKFISVKPVNAIGGLIVIPDNIEHFFFYGTIKSVGPECSKVLRKGMQIFAKRKNGKQFGEMGWIFKEEDILLVMWRGQWHPLGNKILIMRETEEEFYKGLFWIPACRNTKDQTLFGIVLRFGLITRMSPQPFSDDDVCEEDCIITEFFDYPPLRSGDQVKIKEWDMLIEEVGIEEKSCAIIKPSNLDYKIEN